MNTTVKEIDSSRIELHREGKQFSGIKISPTGRPDIWNLRGGDSHDTAWIFRDGIINEWQVEGRFEHHGRYCIGSYFEGERLSTCITDGKLSITGLRKIISALKHIFRTEQIPSSFDAASIFLLTDGSVLMLSSSLAEKQRLCFSDDELLLNYDYFKHPKLTGMSGIVYSCALLAYIVLTNRHPFIDRHSQERNSIEEIRDRMRRSEFVPLSLMKPAVLKDTAGYIDGILKQDTSYSDLDKLYDLLKALDAHPAPALSQTEIEQRKSRARRLERRIHRNGKRRRFIRRHSVSLGIAGILLVAAVILTVSVVNKASIPPPIRGLEPVQVVRLFYESINDLDHTTMEACTINGAGKNYIDSAVRLTVISRVTKAYSLDRPSPYIAVQEWIDSGFPDLNQGQFVFGAANISIRKTGDTEFLVQYIFAQPATVDIKEDPSGVHVVLSERTDRVKIERKKEDYRISSIESEEMREIKSFRELKNE